VDSQEVESFADFQGVRVYKDFQELRTFAESEKMESLETFQYCVSDPVSMQGY
jgi:hypothetical protein